MIEKRLKELVSFEPARYTLLLPGKRIRPQIVLEIAGEEALDAACSIEMIHAYSLIHDDLPCMDDDDYRRGSPTCHTVYGEANALLAGDHLLTKAFEVIASIATLSEKTRLLLTQVLATRGLGMIEGQYLDLNDKENEKVNLLKTGALFQAAFEFGAIIAGKERAPYTEAGAHFGIAYQLLDDIDDDESNLPLAKARKKIEYHLAKVNELIAPLDFMKNFTNYLLPIDRA